MPDFKIYIRSENLDRWNEIERKSEWINSLIKSLDTNKPGIKPEVIKTKKQAIEAVKEVFPDAKPIEPTTYKKTNNWGA